MTNTTSIEQHPDLMALRARYDRAAETPTARALEGLTFLAALYTAVSPWVVGFTNHSDVAINNLIVGLALAVLAIGFASAYGRTHNLAWVAPIIGVWTIIVPWVVLGSPVPVNVIVNNVITGGITVLLGLAMAATGTRAGQRTLR
jgi:hypothetical protein